MKTFVIAVVMLLAMCSAVFADGMASQPAADAGDLTMKVVAAAGVLWAVLSEILSLVPSVKSNGVIQLIMNLLGKVSGKGQQ